MPGAVHDDLAGAGQLGKNCAVVAALVDGKHSVGLRPAADDVRRLEIGQRQGFHICRTAFAGAQPKHLNIPGGLFLYQGLHYIHDRKIVWVGCGLAVSGGFGFRLGLGFRLRISIGLRLCFSIRVQIRKRGDKRGR